MSARILLLELAYLIAMVLFVGIEGHQSQAVAPQHQRTSHQSKE